MLKRLWVNLSTNITLVIKSESFLPTLSIPIIFDLIPSANFTIPPSLELRFMNQDLFLVICLEQPLSIYHVISFWWCDLRHTYIRNNFHFRYPHLFWPFWVNCLFWIFHLLSFCFSSREAFFRRVSLLETIYKSRNFTLRIFGWFSDHLPSQIPVLFYQNMAFSYQALGPDFWSHSPSSQDHI